MGFPRGTVAVFVTDPDPPQSNCMTLERSGHTGEMPGRTEFTPLRLLATRVQELAIKRNEFRSTTGSRLLFESHIT